MAIHPEERKLIKQAIQGDESSFETLILSCKGKAYNIAYRYLRNEEDSLDALQESFIKIYKNLSKFNCESQFDTWVYRIVVNTCNDMLRKNKDKLNMQMTLRNQDDESYEIDIEDKAPGPAELLESKESSTYILDCLEKIGEAHKEVLILRDIKSFSYEEIAEILDCSIGTVKSRISRARKNLKETYFAHLRNEV